MKNTTVKTTYTDSELKQLAKARDILNSIQNLPEHPTGVVQEMSWRAAHYLENLLMFYNVPEIRKASAEDERYLHLPITLSKEEISHI